MASANKPPVVISGTFELPSGQVVSIGDTSWFRWLESSDARSFRFEGSAGTFTARKETPRTGSPYWTASRRLKGQLHKCYLGRSGTLELALLETAAEKLANPEARERKRPAKAIQSVTPAIDSVTSAVDSVTLALALNLSENQDFQQLQAQVAELQNRVAELQFELHRALGNSEGERLPGKEHGAFLQQLAEVTEERDSLSRRNAELEDRLADLAARAGVSFEANKELRRQVAEVTEERDTLRQQVAEVAEERDALERRNAELESQLSELGARTESAPLPDLKPIRERVLGGLRLGRQAPGYKAAARALTAFEEALRGLPQVRAELPICAPDLDPAPNQLSE